MKQLKSVLKYVISFGVAFIWIFPVLWLLVSSFKGGNELFRYPLTFFPEVFTLANYEAALEQFNFLRYIFNTSFITLVASVITILMPWQNTSING